MGANEARDTGEPWPVSADAGIACSWGLVGSLNDASENRGLFFTPGPRRLRACPERRYLNHGGHHAESKGVSTDSVVGGSWHDEPRNSGARVFLRRSSDTMNQGDQDELRQRSYSSKAHLRYLRPVLHFRCQRWKQPVQ